MTKAIGFIVTFLVVIANKASAVDSIYKLSSVSEEYNTKYFYCKTLGYNTVNNSTFYVDAELPSSFVVEIAALKDGERNDFIYNDSKALRISKKKVDTELVIKH